jgi:hypothetical protein
MSRIRKIDKNPVDKQYYLVDSNFLANWFVPIDRVVDAGEKVRVQRSQDWWVEIVAQLIMGIARVYVPEVCVAASFKVLAKKYYRDAIFHSSAEYKFARDLLRDFVHIPERRLKGGRRRISVHDVPVNRDILVSADRFFEPFFKADLNVSLIDLVILSTAKYLLDFYDVPRNNFHIVTLDNSLWRGTRKLHDIPAAYNPNSAFEVASKVFR